MPVQLQHLNIKNFSGGVVDDYIEAGSDHAKTLENFDITPFGKLSTRPGIKPIFDSDFKVPITGMGVLGSDLIISRSTILSRYNETAGTINLINKPNTGDIVTNTLNLPTKYESWSDHLILSNSERQIPKKVYKDSLGIAQVEELGMPDFKEVLHDTVTFAQPRGGNGGIFTYIYALHYSKTYNVGDSIYKTVGKIKYFPVDFLFRIGPYSSTGVLDTEKREISITSIPSLNQAVSDVFLTNAVVEIYRTTMGGSAFYKIGEVSNGTTSVIDRVDDNSLLTANLTLYTSSLLSDGYYQPPQCKHAAVVNNTAFFGNCNEYGTLADRRYRVYQSIPGIINSSHPDFYVDFDYEVIGVSGFKTMPIVFTANAVYRLEGLFNADGTGGIRKVIIADSVGCLSNTSIVKTTDGLIWCGDDGVYFTDGFRSRLLSGKIRKLYKSLFNSQAKKERIVSGYDKLNDRIQFTIGSGDLKTDSMLVYSLVANAFYTYTGDTMQPTAITYKDNIMYYSDYDGYIFKMDELTTTDYLKDISKPITEWSKSLRYKFTTAVFDMGDRFVRKIATRAVIELKSSSDVSVKVISINDDGKISRDMKHIVSKGNWVWGDSGFVWGDPSSVWRKPVTFSSTRRFPRGTTRCRMKQITLEPSPLIVYKSDLYGEWTAISYDSDPASPTFGEILITLPATSIVPTEVIGKEIAFANDGYTQKYTVTKRISDTQFVANAASFNTLTVSSKWQITGNIDNQSFGVESISVKYSIIDNIEGNYDSVQEGGNV